MVEVDNLLACFRMKQPHWAKLEARRLAQKGFHLSVWASLIHLGVTFLLARAWLAQEPLGLVSAGVAAAGIVAEYRLWSQLPGLRKQIDTLKAEAQAWREAKANARRPSQ